MEMEKFILNLSKQGYSKKDIYTMLLNIHAKMEDSEQYNILGDTLDKFVGWTQPGNQILRDERV